MADDLAFLLSLFSPLVEEADGSLSDFRLVIARVKRDMEAGRIKDKDMPPDAGGFDSPQEQFDGTRNDVA